MAAATMLEIRNLETFASRPTPLTAGPLIVATDGTPRSDAALRAARAIADVTGQKVLVLAVHTPLPVLGPEVHVSTSPTMDIESRARMHDQVIEQMARVGLSEQWPLRVSTGSPSALIAKLARNVDAALIVMGLGGHGMFERIFGDEMALQVLRITTVPVLAVAEDFTELPERVLVAMDFSSSAKRALELATPLVQPGGRITVANVIAPSAVSDPSRESASAAVSDHLVARMASSLSVAPGVVRSHSVARGDPAKELLRLAREMDAGLIATGSHGHDFLSRLLIGSVSTKLLRKSGCSILVAPPMDVPDVHDELPRDERRFRFYEWTERLEEFTRLHLWRRAKLEQIDPELGAQVVQSDVPFMGASFDPRDGRVQVMFGARDAGTQHVTHNIDNVTAIQTMRGGARGEVFLRIGHGSGQTLLTLER
jgi:nucleotide-binding universal stress UspA family protein